MQRKPFAYNPHRFDDSGESLMDVPIGLFVEATLLCATNQSVAPSFFQRAFRIPFAMALHLERELERAGVVWKNAAGLPRPVRMTEAEITEFLATLESAE